MSRILISRFGQQALRNASKTTIYFPQKTAPLVSVASKIVFLGVNNQQQSKQLSTSSAFCKGLSPETENPQPKEPESNDTASSTSKVEISTDEFHELSESYLSALVDQLETLQEGREDVDVEYSSGVLNLTFPPNGQYVLNKQPPNKQIWLSSPITGPKRFDFVMMSEGQDAKEGTGAGDWVYLRDGTALSDILLKELGVDMRQFWAPNGAPAAETPV